VTLNPDLLPVRKWSPVNTGRPGNSVQSKGLVLCPGPELSRYTVVMEISGELKPGSRVRQIEILSVLGEGGMGRVYAAYDARLKRRVALKVIRREGARDERLRKRFLREARVLSTLKHPGICQIYDIIEEEEGDFLVLEEVPGRNLRAIISDGMDIGTALDIGAQILEILIVVHREGIIHRDLKPENIMLQPDGRVKILDFGVAGAVREKLTLPPADLSDADDAEDEFGRMLTVEELTTQGVRVGTLRYMSPEQARGEPLSPSSDIYSFGLVLREMITGKVPFGENLDMQVLIQKVGWGDLEPLPGLRSDLRNFLERLTSPAPADRPSARDAVEKLRRIVEAPARRRRRALVASVLVLLTLLSGGLAFQWQRARSEAERAQRLLKETRETSDFLESLFRLSDPFSESALTGRGPVAVETLLEKGVENIRNRFADQPLSRARLMLLLGRIERRIGHFDRAADLLAEAVSILREDQDANPKELGEALLELGETRRRQADYEAAEELFQRALEVVQSGQQEPDRLAVAEIMEYIGLLRMNQGRLEEGARILEQSLKIREEAGGGNALDLALSLQRLGSCEKSLAHYDVAEQHLRRSLEIARSHLGPDALGVASIHNEIGSLELMLRRSEEAEVHYRQALEIGRRWLPEDHPLLGTFLCNLANILDDEGQYEEAARCYTEALSIAEKTVGKEHPETAQMLLNLAMLKQHLGKLDESAELFESCINSLKRSLGPGNPRTGLAMNSYGVLEQERKNYAAARDLYAEALGIFRAGLGPEHPLTAMALNNLGEVSALQGRYRLSERYYREALKAGEKAFGKNDPATAEILKGLARSCERCGKTEDASRFEARAEAILQNASAEN